jgi:hypothetical protein
MAARLPALDRASVTDPGYFPGGMTGVRYGRLAQATGQAPTLATV